MIYKKLYFRLFNAITTALRLLAADDTDSACSVLASAQVECEHEFIESKEENETSAEQ